MTHLKSNINLSPSSASDVTDHLICCFNLIYWKKWSRSKKNENGFCFLCMLCRAGSDTTTSANEFHIAKLRGFLKHVCDRVPAHEICRGIGTWIFLSVVVVRAIWTAPCIGHVSADPFHDGDPFYFHFDHDSDPCCWYYRRHRRHSGHRAHYWNNSRPFLCCSDSFYRSVSCCALIAVTPTVISCIWMPSSYTWSVIWIWIDGDSFSVHANDCYPAILMHSLICCVTAISSVPVRHPPFAMKIAVDLSSSNHCLR